mmetsp:Transcript_8988/g.33899  ORF Transcript_8988/g.33899 Transcript_8988/m.33899 type:complete len:291 (-) Transcript_8988:1927-2799(-)|eukprot:scaffold388_cov244-Pinguiococcus_pyrenoidosus.AAC.34
MPEMPKEGRREQGPTGHSPPSLRRTWSGGKVSRLGGATELGISAFRVEALQLVAVHRSLQLHLLLLLDRVLGHDDLNQVTPLDALSTARTRLLDSHERPEDGEDAAVTAPGLPRTRTGGRRVARVREGLQGDGRGAFTVRHHVVEHGVAVEPGQDALLAEEVCARCEDGAGQDAEANGARRLLRMSILDVDERRDPRRLDGLAGEAGAVAEAQLLEQRYQRGNLRTVAIDLCAVPSDVAQMPPSGFRGGLLRLVDANPILVAPAEHILHGFPCLPKGNALILELDARVAK